MSEAAPRANWGSKLGFILAAAGSAVGLGNVWRFPYLTQENGGGIFVLFYLGAVFFVGLPIMLGELAIGRHTARGVVGAYRRISPPWRWLGYLGVVTGLAIFSYYGVVAGWTVGYLVKSATGDMDPAAFGQFLADPVLQLGYLLLFVVLTGAVVIGGVQKGIERASAVLMPLLLVLLIGLIVRGLFLPTAAEGLRFYLEPDFGKVTGGTVLAALGQSFFSLSLGMGAMITYGSYIKKGDNLLTSAVAVASFDTLVALLAGFMVFPIVGHSLDKGGPTLVFVTMLGQFNGMSGGAFISFAFFLLLAIAALTSTVSLLEVAVAYLIDDRKWSRSRSVVAVCLATALLGIPSALSFGAVPSLTVLLRDKSFFDLVDFVFGNLSLTLGGLLMSVFLIYRWGIGNAAAEVADGFPRFRALVPVWRVLLGALVPIAIGGLLVYNLWTEVGG